MEVNLQYDPDPYIKYSKKALELVRFLGKDVPGRIVVGGSPKSSVDPKYLITKRDVEKRIDQLHEINKEAEIWLFPGDERMASDELIKKSDGIMVSCVYNSTRKNFDQRQIKFYRKYKRLEKGLKRLGKKVEFVFYLIYSQNATAYEIANAWPLSPSDAIAAFAFWFPYGNFDRYYLEATGCENIPYTLVGKCTSLAKENGKLFTYGGSIKEPRQALRLERLGVPTVHIGNALHENPDSVQEILKTLSKKLYSRVTIS